MPNISDVKEVTRKILPIFYVIDSSGSMCGEKISQLNEAMRDTIEIIKDISNTNPDARIQIGVLQFSCGSEWITKNGLENVEDFIWTDLEANGVTDLGDALNELNQKLSIKNGILKSDVGFNMPVIIFMSDGGPTDDYESALKNALENKWFKRATKIALAIGEDADKDVLAKVVGNVECVLTVNNIDQMKKMIRIVSTTASMMASKSRSANDTDLSTDIVKQAQAEAQAEEESSLDPKDFVVDNFD